MIDDKLHFSDHIAKTGRSCRLALYNIKKIRPFLSEHATQLLVQALVLSRLDNYNALLAGLPANSTKPLQLIQNATTRLIFNEPKRMHVTQSVHQIALATISCSHYVCLQNHHWLCTTLPKRILQVNNRLLCHPKEAQNHFHRLFY